MTIASEITRLQWAKTTARTSIINKGVDVPVNASVEDYHTYIDQIQQGVPTSAFAGLYFPYSWDITTIDSKNNAWDQTAYLCRIGWYDFAIGTYGYTDISWWRYNSYAFVGIRYKAIDWTSWTLVSGWQFSWPYDSTLRTITINAVYNIQSNAISIEATATAYNSGTTTQIFNWTLWSNSMTTGSALSWSNIANYKIADCISWLVSVATSYTNYYRAFCRVN